MLLLPKPCVFLFYSLTSPYSVLAAGAVRAETEMRLFGAMLVASALLPLVAAECRECNASPNTSCMTWDLIDARPGQLCSTKVSDCIPPALLQHAAVLAMGTATPMTLASATPDTWALIAPSASAPRASHLPTHRVAI